MATAAPWPLRVPRWWPAWCRWRRRRRWARGGARGRLGGDGVSHSSAARGEGGGGGRGSPPALAAKPGITVCTAANAARAPPLLPPPLSPLPPWRLALSLPRRAAAPRLPSPPGASPHGLPSRLAFGCRATRRVRRRRRALWTRWASSLVCRKRHVPRTYPVEWEGGSALFYGPAAVLTLAPEKRPPQWLFGGARAAALGSPSYKRRRGLPAGSRRTATARSGNRRAVTWGGGAGAPPGREHTRGLAAHRQSRERVCGARRDGGRGPRRHLHNKARRDGPQ